MTRNDNLLVAEVVLLGLADDDRRRRRRHGAQRLLQLHGSLNSLWRLAGLMDVDRKPGLVVHGSFLQIVLATKVVESL